EAAALQAAKQTVAPGGAGTAPAATFVDLDKAAVARQGAAFGTGNGHRRLAGLAPVTSSPVIHQSALAHAFYTFFNGALPSIQGLGIHNEDPAGQGYPGANQATRAQHFGYSPPSMGEVIPHRSEPVGAVADWID